MPFSPRKGHKGHLEGPVLSPGATLVVAWGTEVFSNCPSLSNSV